MSTLDVAGATIHYEVSGKEGAPWLVFSNSLGTNLEMWDAQARDFADSRRILRYDQRGHGKSSAPQGDYTMDQLGGDVVALLDELDIARADFCGLSMGGMTGMWLGTHAGHRFDRLVLANTGAQMPPPELWDGRIRTVLEKGMEGVLDAVVERWFTPEFRQQATDEIEILSTSPVGYAGCSAAIRDMDQRESIRAVTTPTLVIAGARDPATPPAMADEIVANIAGARLATLDAAHLSNIEKADDFSRVLQAFLSETVK